jgi:hypothetical protein
LIEKAVSFRCSTARQTIQYRVINSRQESPSDIGVRFVQQLPVFTDYTIQHGVIYVYSYTIGEVVSSVLKCRFYKAYTGQKAEILKV